MKNNNTTFNTDFSFMHGCLLNLLFNFDDSSVVFDYLSK